MMKPYQQRVIAEREELNTRLRALTSFKATPSFKNLSDQEQEMLTRQARIMGEYFDVLTERIAVFEQEDQT